MVRRTRPGLAPRHRDDSCLQQVSLDVAPAIEQKVAVLDHRALGTAPPAVVHEPSQFLVRCRAPFRQACRDNARMGMRSWRRGRSRTLPDAGMRFVPGGVQGRMEGEPGQDTPGSTPRGRGNHASDQIGEDPMGEPKANGGNEENQIVTDERRSTQRKAGGEEVAARVEERLQPGRDWPEGCWSGWGRRRNSKARQQTGANGAGGWKAALNHFAIVFENRLPPRAEAVKQSRCPS